MTLLAGCGSTPAPQADSQVTRVVGIVTTDPSSSPLDNPPAGIPTDFLVQRRTWGGMCPTGPCDTLLLVGASGAWTWRANGKITEGRLSRSEVESLVRAARVTLLDRATGAADCAANGDGTSVGYAWTVGGVTKSMSSCEHPIDRRDPLVIELERTAAAVVP